MAQSPVSIRSFASIEQLDELPREMGWPLEYRQLDRGFFSSTFSNLEHNSWFLMGEQSNSSVEVVGGAPSGMFILALVEGNSAVVNGQSLGSDHIFLQCPGSDFRATLPAGIKVTQLGVVAERFEDVMHSVAPELSVPRGAVSVFAAAPGRLESVRRAMRATLQAPSSQQITREEAASRFIADILAAAFDQSKIPEGSGLHRAAARRALNRARDYIETHMDEGIRIELMCQYAGTSLRSLERIFARELGVSPQRYVMARRLNAARRRLLAANEEQGVRITEVAHGLGFTHMGRFAGDYRLYFGESPRQTLRSRLSHRQAPNLFLSNFG